MKHFVIAVTNDGHSDRRMNRLAVLLRKHGWMVTLVARVFEPRMHDEGYHFIECKREKGPLAYWEYNIKLANWLRRVKIDVLCAVDVDTLLGMLFARLPGSTKVIVDSHEFFAEVPELEGQLLKKRIWRMIARQGFRKADQRWTVSTGLARALRDRYNQDFYVVPNYPRSFPLSANRRKQVLVYLGVLNKGRGLDLLIRSMHSIDGQLWLLGEGDLSQDLRTLVRTEGLDEKIEFKGWVATEAISTLLQEATIGINLLESSSASYHLSLANKFFDYVQAGTPQVCMSFPSYSAKLKQYQVGLTIDQLDMNDFVRQCQRLLNDRILWAKMHNQCLEARKEWNFSKIESSILDLVKSLDAHGTQ